MAEVRIDDVTPKVVIYEAFVEGTLIPNTQLIQELPAKRARRDLQRDELSRTLRRILEESISPSTTALTEE